MVCVLLENIDGDSEVKVGTFTGKDPEVVFYNAMRARRLSHKKLRLVEHK
jgi:hypothetical protein